MNITQVSATLSTTDREAVMAAISAIREKLPFLIDLTIDQRRTMAKFGPKSESFVRKAVQIAAQNMRMLPAAFDLEEMRKDAELFDALAPIRLAIDQLQKQVRDTSILAGSEAYTAARAVYAYSKTGVVRGSLEVGVEHLGKRFARKTNGSAPANDPDTPAPTVTSPSSS